MIHDARLVSKGQFSLVLFAFRITVGVSKNLLPLKLNANLKENAVNVLKFKTSIPKITQTKIKHELTHFSFQCSNEAALCAYP